MVSSVTKIKGVVSMNLVTNITNICHFKKSNSYQLLSRSTCSNSIALSTILFFPLAVRWRDKEIQTWSCSILTIIYGKMRKLLRSFSSGLFTMKLYVLFAMNGVKITHCIVSSIFSNKQLTIIQVIYYFSFYNNS